MLGKTLVHPLPTTHLKNQLKKYIKTINPNYMGYGEKQIFKFIH
jgi:hypothetical protein